MECAVDNLTVRPRITAVFVKRLMSDFQHVSALIENPPLAQIKIDEK